MVKKFFILIFFLFSFSFYISYGLSLEEAIEMAKVNYPKLKLVKEEKLASKFAYKSNIFNFTPIISYSFSYSKYSDIEPLSYFNRNHSININWVIFNGGKNIIQYQISKNEYFNQSESYKEEVLDTVYSVKKAYFIATAYKEVLKYRKEQLKYAEIDYKVAVEKYKLGLVKKSDVLNSKVRFENAKYNYIQSKSDYETSIAELNSLIGLPLEAKTEVDEKEFYSFCNEKIENFQSLYKQMLVKRPLLKALRIKEKISELNTKQAIYDYTPSISLFFQRNKSYSSLSGKDYYSIYGVKLDWLIFDGLGRYYRYLSAKHSQLSVRYDVKETLRKIKLNLYKTYITYKKNLERLNLAREIVKQAEENYRQTLGEYKVGKNDIVALVNSEKNLADAQINLVNSVLNVVLTKIEIDREVGRE